METEFNAAASKRVYQLKERKDKLKDKGAIRIAKRKEKTEARSKRIKKTTAKRLENNEKAKERKIERATGKTKMARQVRRANKRAARKKRNQAVTGIKRWDGTHN